MKVEELQKLEEGTLIVIHGKGYFGLEHKVVMLQKKDIWVGKQSNGYFYCSSLYPFEWVKLATEKDLENEIKLAQQYAERRTQALKKAFEKTTKARKK